MKLIWGIGKGVERGVETEKERGYREGQRGTEKDREGQRERGQRVAKRSFNSKPDSYLAIAR